MSKVFLARSLTNGLAMDGMRSDAGPVDRLPSLMRYGTDMVAGYLGSLLNLGTVNQRDDSSSEGFSSDSVKIFFDIYRKEQTV